MNLNPMMVAQLREQLKGVKAEIRIEYPESRMIVTLGGSPENQATIQSLLENLGTQFAQVMGTYMGIQGEIVEVGKAEYGPPQ